LVCDSSELIDPRSGSGYNQIGFEFEQSNFFDSAFVTPIRVRYRGDSDAVIATTVLGDSAVIAHVCPGSDAPI